MNTLPTASTTVKLNLSSGLRQNALDESERIGISLQDFIRMLMGTYFAKSGGIRSLTKDERLLVGAKLDIQSGNVTKIKNSKQLREHLLSL